jgi:hypothetical protein
MFECCSGRKPNGSMKENTSNYRINTYQKPILMVDEVTKTKIKDIKGFLRGMPDGLWLETSLTHGDLCYVSSIRFFCNGLPSGCWREFSPSGWEKWKCCFDNGTRHGLEVHFIDKNTPDRSIEYNRGVRDGNSFSFSRTSNTQYAFGTTYSVGRVIKQTVLSKSECIQIENELKEEATGHNILESMSLLESEYIPNEFDPFKYFSLY